MAGSAVAAYLATEAALAIDWWRAGLALIVALALQVAVNYANDYSDGIRGTDDERVGPLRLVGSGTASPAAVKKAMLVSFAVAAVAGLVLAAVAAWWLVVVGAVCVAAAWYYTGGSRPYGYLGLGEVMVFVFFGLVAVIGTTFVLLEQFAPLAILPAVGVGALACAILVANNLRDLDGDTAVGKRTLAVKLGDPGSRALFVALYLSATLALMALAAASTWWVLLGLAAAVPGQGALRAIWTGVTGPQLVPVLARTGAAELFYALGLGAGLLLGA